MSFFDQAAQSGIEVLAFEFRRVNQFVGVMIHFVAALGANHLSV